MLSQLLSSTTRYTYIFYYKLHLVVRACARRVGIDALSLVFHPAHAGRREAHVGRRASCAARLEPS